MGGLLLSVCLNCILILKLELQKDFLSIRCGDTIKITLSSGR